MTTRSFAYAALLLVFAGAVTLGVVLSVSRFNSEPAVQSNSLASVPDFTVLGYGFGPVESHNPGVPGVFTMNAWQGCVDYVVAGTGQTSCYVVSLAQGIETAGGNPLAKFGNCMRRVTIGSLLPECWRS
jgi:hypothetical protein